MAASIPSGGKFWASVRPWLSLILSARNFARITAPLAVLGGLAVAIILFSQIHTGHHGTPVDIVASISQSGANAASAEAIAAGITAENQVETFDPIYSYNISIALPNPNITRVEARLLRLRHGRFFVIDKRNPNARALPVSHQDEKGGTSLIVPPNDFRSPSILGNFSPESFIRPKFSAWSSPDYLASSLEFERSGGLYFGAMLALATFSFLVALLNREISYLLLSAWLVTSLRVAAINQGWDFEWVATGTRLPDESTLLRCLLAFHGLFTVELFRELFSKEIKHTRLSNALTALSVGWIATAFVSVLATPRQALPGIWAMGAITITTLIYAIARILGVKRSRTVAWYSVSWAFLLGGILSDIAFATGILASSQDVLNSTTGSLFSALTMALAIAERMTEDRTARVEAQTTAISALKRFQQTYDNVPIGLCTFDQSGNLLEFNPAFNSIVPIRQSLANSQDWQWEDIFNIVPFVDILATISESGNCDVESTITLQTKTLWVRIRAAREGNFIAASVEDITARKEADFQIRRVADHDPLTGLLNRRGFDSAYANTLRDRDPASDLCIAYIDLDRFKLVNDLFGHAAGDNVLQQVANRLLAVIPSCHHIARVGGDEFLVVLHGIPVREAKALCEQMLESLRSTPYQFQDKAFAVEASIGLTKVEKTMSEKDAVSTADRACADAKRAGGSHVVVLNENSAAAKQHLDEIRIIADIREKFGNDRLFTVVQPLIALNNPHQSLCYEVLLRMRDDNGSVIPPKRFIGAAERNGMMAQIDRWVLEDTLNWLDSNQSHRTALTLANINVSGASLNDERFVSDVASMLREHSTSAQKICFEITESVALYDLQSTRKFIDIIHGFGSKLALDDFGAGYTSFSYLKDLESDFVKVDGGFVRDINSNPANFAISRAISDVAHELGMQCIAEWAESADIVKSLKQINVDYAQGFGLCRPLSKSDMLRHTDGSTLVSIPSMRVALELTEPALHA